MTKYPVSICIQVFETGKLIMWRKINNQNGSLSLLKKQILLISILYLKEIQQSTNEALGQIWKLFIRPDNYF